VDKTRPFIIQSDAIPGAYAVLHFSNNPLTSSWAFIGRVLSGLEAWEFQTRFPLQDY
jgi:hypothetical protein